MMKVSRVHRWVLHVTRFKASLEDVTSAFLELCGVACLCCGVDAYKPANPRCLSISRLLHIHRPSPLLR